MQYSIQHNRHFLGKFSASQQCLYTAVVCPWLYVSMSLTASGSPGSIPAPTRLLASPPLASLCVQPRTGDAPGSLMFCKPPGTALFIASSCSVIRRIWATGTRDPIRYICHSKVSGERRKTSLPQQSGNWLIHINENIPDSGIHFLIRNYTTQRKIPFCCGSVWENISLLVQLKFISYRNKYDR